MATEVINWLAANIRRLEKRVFELEVRLKKEEEDNAEKKVEEVPQVQHMLKDVGNPLLKQQQVPMIQNVQKTAEVAQKPADEAIDFPKVLRILDAREKKWEREKEKEKEKKTEKEREKERGFQKVSRTWDMKEKEREEEKEKKKERKKESEKEEEMNSGIPKLLRILEKREKKEKEKEKEKKKEDINSGIPRLLRFLEKREKKEKEMEKEKKKEGEMDIEQSALAGSPRASRRSLAPTTCPRSRS